MKKLTFEQAGAQLEEILRQLSEEETTLEESLTLYAKAAELMAFCNKTLQDVQVRLDEIDANFKGELA